jgi:hypothetical protein
LTTPVRRRSITRIGEPPSEASDHCERYEVSRCSKDPTQHIVRIEWTPWRGICPDSVRAPEFGSFFEAARPFVHDIKEMRHYEVTISSAGRSQS